MSNGEPIVGTFNQKFNNLEKSYFQVPLDTCFPAHCSRLWDFRHRHAAVWQPRAVGGRAAAPIH